MDSGGVAAPGTGAMIPGVRVSVETVLLGACDLGLTYRVGSGQLGDREHPDALARTLAGLHDQPHPGALLHSTSWRFAPGGVILTYAALPDPDPTGAAILPDLVEVAGSENPVAPCPTHVTTVQVVAHACRHLAWLRHTDPLVAALPADAPELWALIDRHRPAAAGQLSPPAPVPVAG